ncbi:MAG TPA: NAD(P)H-dependent oxidoreductase [Acidisarcina sp.]
MTLLHLDSSPAGERSVSRHLSAEYVHNWKLANPGGSVITRDTTTSEIPPVTAEWITAIYTPEAARSERQRELLTLSDSLVAELVAADEYILGVPMHNFSIPSTLKLWIDQVAVPNKTFSYATGRPVGLLTGKRATILIASGGMYDAGTAMMSLNHAEPYLRTIFGFFGVTDVTFISAGGTSSLNSGADRQSFLEPLVALVRAQFQVA